jgi:hypothetical protein
MHVNMDREGKIELDITDDHNELNNWVERIGKTANEIYDDPACNHIKLNGQHTVLSLNLMTLVHWGCLGWAIEQHLDAISP